MYTPNPTSRVVPPRTLPLRGRVLRAVALKPEAPLQDWFALLDAALQRSPTLLREKAVLLDAGALEADSDGLEGVVVELAARGIRVVGIENADAFAAAATLPPFLAGGRPVGTPLDAPTEPALSSMTIEGTVRSGQTIVNREGDVTVMGSVSSGAEILAGGSIHVYGALRGRAIAGAAKNPRARIYCRKFEPELLGIDRLVRTAEDMGNQLRGQAVQIWSDGGAIKIAALV